MNQQYQMINEIDGFSLVGSGKSHYWCGIWQTFGCLNHKQAYVRQFKKTCFRSECKVCYVSWVSRQANRTVKKLNRMKRNNILHHAVLTIPTTWNKETKQNLIKSLKNIGVESACIIHTPFDEDQRYYLKNTLHIFYYGKMVNLYSLPSIHFERLDDPGDNLFRTLQTQFLNCGVKKGTHPISWIGKTIYCTLEIKNDGVDGRNCPLVKYFILVVSLQNSIKEMVRIIKQIITLQNYQKQSKWKSSINKMDQKILLMIMMVYSLQKQPSNN